MTALSPHDAGKHTERTAVFSRSPRGKDSRCAKTRAYRHPPCRLCLSEAEDFRSARFQPYNWAWDCSWHRRPVGLRQNHHLNLLTRIFDVQQGSVEICGMDVRLWPLEQLRGSFSYVSQNGGIFFSGMRILDIIRFTRPEASLSDVIQATQAACIHDEICYLPEKYNSRLGEGGMSLSRGQQQRIALAQALVAMDSRRKILMLDEFTSALDSETEERILQNLEPWLENRTVIIIAHRLSTVRKLADEIIVLDSTGIVEQGTHASLLAEAAGMPRWLAFRMSVLRMNSFLAGAHCASSANFYNGSPDHIPSIAVNPLLPAIR